MEAGGRRVGGDRANRSHGRESRQNQEKKGVVCGFFCFLCVVGGWGCFCFVGAVGGALIVPTAAMVARAARIKKRMEELPSPMPFLSMDEAIRESGERANGMRGWFMRNGMCY